MKIRQQRAGMPVPAAHSPRIARFARDAECLRAVAGTVLLRRAIARLSEVLTADLLALRTCPRCGLDQYGKPWFPGPAFTPPPVTATGSSPSRWLRPVCINIEAVAAYAPGEWELDECARVESVLKATGDGLVIDPRSVELMLDGDHRCVTAYGKSALDAVTVDLPRGSARSVRLPFSPPDRWS